MNNQGDVDAHFVVNLQRIQMKEFKVEKDDVFIFHYSTEVDSNNKLYTAINMRRTFRCWLGHNLRNLFSFKFKYIPLILFRGLRGYTLDDMEWINYKDFTILRFDKCCKNPYS